MKIYDKIFVRPENAEDTKSIYSLHESAFGRSNEAQLVDLLRKSSVYIPALSLVAIFDHTVVGHILFTKIKIVSNQQEYPSLALAPMAVAPDFQQNGIGSLLVRQGLETAQALAYPSVIVLGHEKYYTKFGFTPTSQWNIFSPYEVPPTAFMGIELQTDVLKNVSGTVHYPKEFGMV